MSNNSTFESGFHVTTNDYSTLDLRYLKIGYSLAELTGSTAARLSASRHIFGSGSGFIPSDCTLRSSGSASTLRFNTTTASLSSGNAALWEGALVYDTDPDRLFYANSNRWVKILDELGPQTIAGDLILSASGTTNYSFAVSSSNSGIIGIYTPSYSLLSISASAADTTISNKRDLLFKSSTGTLLGVISSSGDINFSSGKFTLGSGSSSPNIVNGNLTVTNTLSASAISCSGDIIAFTTSDERLKSNLRPLTENLYKLSFIDGYSFEWNQGLVKTGKDLGVIAQEIEKIFPEAVVDRADGYKAVDYIKLIPFLIGCIKELNHKLDEK